MFIRFDRMYERDGRTDGHRMTAEAALDASIVPPAKMHKKSHCLIAFPCAKQKPSIQKSYKQKIHHTFSSRVGVRRNNFGVV